MKKLLWAGLTILSLSGCVEDKALKENIGLTPKTENIYDTSDLIKQKSDSIKIQALKAVVDVLFLKKARGEIKKNCDECVDVLSPYLSKIKESVQMTDPDDLALIMSINANGIPEIKNIMNSYYKFNDKVNKVIDMKISMSKFVTDENAHRSMAIEYQEFLNKNNIPTDNENAFIMAKTENVLNALKENFISKF